MSALGLCTICVAIAACDEAPRRPDGPRRDLIAAEAGVADSTSRDHGGQDTAADAAPPVTVQPQEITDLLSNPGMGWQTFHHVASNDPSLAGLPSGSAYYRWTWKNLEPTQGSYNIALVKNTLSAARAAGQTLMFRVMTAGSDQAYAPSWLKSAGCKMFAYQADTAGLEAPDLDDATCWALHAALIGELGKQLAGEPDLQIDIGSVGLWGEWHFSGTSPQVPMPTLATRKKVVDLYFATFPKTPLAALIGETEALAYAVSKGAGWRADCLGDYGFFSSTWNHMDNMYKQNVAAAGANDAWKTGPVAWESCGDMSDWVQLGFDVRKIFQYALDMHGSFVNNKSATLPAGAQYRQEVETLIRKLGYRFVLRKLTHPQSVARGAEAEIVMSWENVGVAPCYASYALAFRLAPSSGGKESVQVTPRRVGSWLPGPFEVRDKLTVDSALQPGSYALSVGIVDAASKPIVRLAIAGRDASGWYPVSTMVVK